MIIILCLIVKTYNICKIAGSMLVFKHSPAF
jgi:hypothetical protein